MRRSSTIAEVPGNFWNFDAFIPQTPEALTYDADGNLTSDSMWDYTYDAENRLVQMTMKTAVAQQAMNQQYYRVVFAYDHMGRRIQKRIETVLVSQQQANLPISQLSWQPQMDERYMYQGPGEWLLMATIRMDPESGMYAQQYFAWGPDLSGTEQGAGGIGGLAIFVDEDSPTPSFPLYDGNGNVVMTYSSELGGGNVPRKTAEYRYGPFGENRGQLGDMSDNNPFRWSTKFTDNETGLVYYGYRYYSASLGRWINRDPIEEVGGPTLYSFVGNRPTGAFDAQGLYARDYHFYAVYFMARAQCMDPHDAKELAHYSQAVDDHLFTNPLHLGVAELWQFLSPFGSVLGWFEIGPVFGLRDYHFWGSSPTKAVTRNAAEPGNRFSEALRRKDFAGAGRWLHTYADSWPHEGFTAWPSYSINSRGGGPFLLRLSFIGHVDTSEDGHYPDNPYNDPPKAMESAARILWRMGYFGRCHCRDLYSVSGGLWQMFTYPNPDENARALYNRFVIQSTFGDWVNYDDGEFGW